jgi:hypothetical protein
VSRVNLATAALLILAAAIAARLGMEQLSSRRFVRVDDVRMEPAIGRGWLAVLEQVPVGNLAIGDVIQYTHPSQPGAPVLLRVSEELAPRGSRGSGRLFRLRGDSPNQDVPWDAELHGAVWRLWFAVPAVGWFASLDRKILLTVLLASALVGILSAMGAARFGRATRRAA